MTKPGSIHSWRSQAEFEGGDRYEEMVALARDRHPALAPLLYDKHSRRNVLRLMGASLAMGGLAGCGRSVPPGTIVPAVVQAPGIVPGVAEHYSSVAMQDGYANGIVVRHQEGRPIKVEGNLHHPASLGSTDAIGQAQILSFYDPYRDKGVSECGSPASWNSFQTGLRNALAGLGHGDKLRILTGATTSSTLARQIGEILKTYPAARWCQWDAVSRANIHAGAILAYGTPVEIVPQIDQARVIVGFDSDLFDRAPGYLAHARNWAAARNPANLRGLAATAGMSRVYTFETAPSLFGAAADHRRTGRPDDQRSVLYTIATAIINNTTGSIDSPWLVALINDLRQTRGEALIHLGPDHPAEYQALGIAINEALGARDRTMRVIERVGCGPTDAEGSFRELVAEMQKGQVDVLLMLDCNPVLTAPIELGFFQALKRVRFSVAVGTEYNETAALARWFVPATHNFEGWSDARAFDGTATIVQPQVLPVYGAKSPHEVLALFLGSLQSDPRAIVRETWAANGIDDSGWIRALAEGVLPDTAARSSDVTLKIDRIQPPPPFGIVAELTLVFRPDPYLDDGRYANNPWLQELPRPMTKLVWDNPLLISPKLAAAHGLKNGDLAHIRVKNGSFAFPVFVSPGQDKSTVVALLGFGRKVTGDVGRGAGFDYYPLRETDDVTQTAILGFAKAEGSYPLATTEHHALVDGDPADAIRHTTYAAYQANHDLLHKPAPDQSLYAPVGPPLPVSAVKWGMSIDLNTCIGCNACVAACQAENNIPTVGKEEVGRQREMHWLRIDRYYEGDIDAPDAYFQPVLCMHCEDAPCEVVCPVGATMHDAEGLNVMVYNRCVGTRFCSNNCPYKVRRFNYFAYAKEETRPPESRNNDVTTRARGVMEKCTFCVQRIAAARIESDKSNGTISEDRVVTACQAACPTQAFSFGDIGQPNNEVSRRKASPLNYALLDDRNTRPRVTYEGVVRNPNPALEKGGA